MRQAIVCVNASAVPQHMMCQERQLHSRRWQGVLAALRHDWHCRLANEYVLSMLGASDSTSEVSSPYKPLVASLLGLPLLFNHFESKEFSCLGVACNVTYGMMPFLGHDDDDSLSKK
jgi:hypothetical protein